MRALRLAPGASAVAPRLAFVVGFAVGLALPGAGAGAAALAAVLAAFWVADLGLTVRELLAPGLADVARAALGLGGGLAASDPAASLAEVLSAAPRAWAVCII